VNQSARQNSEIISNMCLEILCSHKHCTVYLVIILAENKNEQLPMSALCQEWLKVKHLHKFNY